MENLKKICTVTWDYTTAGKIGLTFTNHLTGVTMRKEYKTIAAAKAQETKFARRAARVYG